MNYYPIIIEDPDLEPAESNRGETVARAFALQGVAQATQPAAGTEGTISGASHATWFAPADRPGNTDPMGTPHETYFPAGFGTFGSPENRTGRISDSVTGTDGTNGTTTGDISRAEILEMIDRKIATIRVEVVETDITRAQNTIKAIVEQATY